MNIAITDDTLVSALEDIGAVRAPSTLLPRVLDAVRGGEVRFASVATEIGDMWIAWSARGVRAAMRFVSAEEFAQWYASRFGVVPVRAAALPDALRRNVLALLAGESRASVEFDLGGLRPFERDVLQTALRIPRGEVRPYSWIARRIGRPLAVRAVGTALANNPIPYLIPCHRVIRADGQVGEYGGGGPAAKRAILTWEGIDTAELETLARRGIRFLGSDTTRIFCYPTCRHARRITPAHRVPFTTAESARAAGYRGCKDCTPVSMAA